MIDLIIGVVKEGVFFIFEVILRGIIFYGNIRIFDKLVFVGLELKVGELFLVDNLREVFDVFKYFFEILGIGGMIIRGFGRLKLEFKDEEIEDEEGICI